MKSGLVQEMSSDGNAQGVAKPQRVYAPRWSNEDGLSTTIYIRNVHISQTITAKLSLILGHRTITLPAARVAPLQTVAVDVARTLAGNGERVEQSGGAAIDFVAESAGAVNAYAQVLDTAKSISLSFPFMERVAPDSRTLEAVTWRYSKNTDAFVALQNTTERAVKASITAFIEGQAVNLGQRRLGPLGVETVKLPAVSKRANRSEQQSAGVRVQYEGEAGALMAQGWVMDAGIGFSAPFDFHQKSTCNCGSGKQHLYGAGVQIGAAGAMMNLSPGTTFSPYLAVRNISEKPLAISPVFKYMAGDRMAAVTLPSILLGQQENTLVNLKDFQGRGLIPAWVGDGNIDLQYEGEAGALIAELTSVDQGGSYVSPTPLSCRGNRALQMVFWRTDGDWHSGVTIENVAPVANEVEITISYPGGTYLLEKKIAAGDTAMISINELQQLQVPDKTGRTIPKKATLGGLNIWSRNVNDGLVLNAMTVNPVTRTCGVCGAQGYATSWYLVETDALNTAIGFEPHGVGDAFLLKMNIRFSTGGITGDSARYISSSNITVASQDPNQGGVLCRAIGSATITGETGQNYFTDNACSAGRILRTSSALTVRARLISGPTQFWWFNGQTPTGYALQITLTATPTGASSYQWAVVNGQNKVNFSNNTDSMTTTTNQVTVLSTAASETGADVSIQVTVNGQVSAPHKIIVRAPHRLIPGTVTHQADATFGYSTFINYTIVDQFGGSMPSGVPINEFWATGVVNDYAGTNWRRGTAGSFTTPGATFADHIQGEHNALPPTPAATAPLSPLGTTRVQHWGQDWYVGSLTSGVGRRVQRDTLQKYTDHAIHTGIATPAP